MNRGLVTFSGVPYPRNCGEDWIPNGLRLHFEPVLRRRELR